jgi:hypothetical protein
LTVHERKCGVNERDLGMPGRLGERPVFIVTTASPFSVVRASGDLFGQAKKYRLHVASRKLAVLMKNRESGGLPGGTKLS